MSCTKKDDVNKGVYATLASKGEKRKGSPDKKTPTPSISLREGEGEKAGKKKRIVTFHYSGGESTRKRGDPEEVVHVREREA